MIDSLNESKKWYEEKLVETTLKALEKNHIRGFYVETKERACEKILSLTPPGSKIGYGGSLTLDQIGIKNTVRKGEYIFLDHEKHGLTAKEQMDLRKESLFSDVFLMSANALTMEGHIINIDGFGNRVASLIFGPQKVIVVAGINKIVKDTVEAVKRIKNYVAPIHARRRGRNLPCAKTGYCVNCHDMERFCNALVIIEHQYFERRDRINVCIVGEELGL